VRPPIRAACKGTPPAGKHSSVGETAEIKSAIQDKNQHQESGRCTKQNDRPGIVRFDQLILL
jgi:hypothetical protein